MYTVLIIVGIIVFIIAFILWSTITVEIASNGKKTIITLSMYRFIKYEIVLPEKDKASEPKNDADASASDNKPDNEQDNESDNESKRSSRLKRELSSMWDSETRFFDIPQIKKVFNKYMSLAKSGKSAVGSFLKHLRRKIRVARFDIYLRFGMGEPDKTGIAYGAVCGLAGALIPPLRGYFKMENEFGLYLDPNYVAKCFAFEAGSIIKTRGAYVINALVAALAVFIINYVKGSVKNVRNFRQASD